MKLFFSLDLVTNDNYVKVLQFSPFLNPFLRIDFMISIMFFDTLGGSLASDDLYLLDMRGSDDTGIWTVVPVVG